MSCADFEKLIALYAGGDLPERDAARVETHLGQCDSCRGLAAELASDRQWLQSAHGEPADRSTLHQVRTSVMRQLEAEQSRWNGPLGWLLSSRWIWQVVVTAAAVVLAVAGVVWRVAYFQADLTIVAVNNSATDGSGQIARSRPPVSPPAVDSQDHPGSVGNPDAEEVPSPVAAARRESVSAPAARHREKPGAVNPTAANSESVDSRTLQALVAPLDEPPRKSAPGRPASRGTPSAETAQIEVIKVRLDEPDQTSSDAVMLKLPTSNTGIVVYWLMDDQEKGD